MKDSGFDTPAVTALGRLLLALIFVMSGFGKLMGPAGAIGYIAHVGLPMPPAAYAVSVIVELGGGVLLLAGFLSRWVALALALFCLATAFAVHGFADQNNMIHAMKNIAIAGGFLFVMAHGAGAWSVDAMFARNRGTSAQPA